MKAEGKVLITGVNGFVGSHIAKLLLEGGYKVRGTVRDKGNKEKLASLSTLPAENLELREADLTDSASIEKAIEGCDYVIHVAAPVVMTGDESSIVKPAVDGTKFVMEAAIKHKVKKVVMTSSLVAVVNLEVADKKVLDESDWPDVEKPQPLYLKAKTVSEKVAWDIYNKASKEARPKLAVIDPGFILGPTLTKLPFHSGNFVREALLGKLEGISRLLYAVVDVRDVALAHVKALEKAETDGQRYVCFSGEYLWMEEIAKVLKAEFEQYGYKIEGKVLDECPDKDPNSFLNVRWGKNYKLTNEKIRKDLGIEFIKAKDSVKAMGYSMIAQGLVPDLIKKHAA
eukprot:TRINITY_DN5048_c0_g1_i10.p1 TRINITY_DN5048_c0_g1~~TRINITY_DN5048_c0_g1_i10.p1  ORF type:complete len:342 (-),score=93.95 TRINITY_DN5048_c0_g1_i10:120-1145(-)